MITDLKDYVKPYCTIQELLELLSSRGLIIDDAERAAAFLSTVNYYRFSGYVLLFLEKGSRTRYRSDVCFGDIIDVYQFDKRLRDIFFEALEAIELTFRTQFAREFSRTYSSLAYLNPTHYEDARLLNTSLRIAESEIANTPNRFIEHLRSSYKQIPIWALVEIMSFGWLVKLYSNLKRNVQRVIANDYGIKGDILHSYMRHASVLRNTCAHHGRLFDNRTYGFKPLKEWRGQESVRTNSIFCQAALLYRLMRPTANAVFDREDWKNRIVCLFDSLPEKFGCLDYRTYASIPYDCGASWHWVK